MNVRMSESDHRILSRALRSSFSGNGDEVGVILLVARNNHPRNPSLLVREVLQPREGDFSEQGVGQLTFSGRFLRRAMLRAKELGLAGILTVHTHPMSDESVRFSYYDNAEDPKLMANLYDQEPDGIFGSIVAGRAAMQGRVWQVSEETWRPLDALIIVGESIEILSLDGEKARDRAPAPAAFDKSLALTGTGALAALSKMRVAFVGASGTGSLAIELAQRCGIGEIVVFEFDRFDGSNLGRVLHLRVEDANNKRRKGERFAEVVKETELGSKVSVIEGGNITFQDVADELRGVDAILGCVDNSHWARLVMTEVAYQYLVPYIDLGSEIGMNGEKVHSLDSRVSFSGVGRPCLVCSGIIDREQVRLEGLTEGERKRVLDMGYTKSQPITVPAVMELNMRAASYGMLVLRHLLQPFLDTPIPTHIKESVTVFSIKRIVTKAKSDCLICGEQGRKALGDGRPLTVRRGKAAGSS